MSLAPKRAIAGLGLALCTLALGLALTIGPSGAQTTASTTSTSVLTAPSTTAAMAIDQSAITSKGSPTHPEGRIVGGVAFGVIVVGALVLWLKYRKRGTTT
jgi:hypothetical protein